jgi:hypothetical protein
MFHVRSKRKEKVEPCYPIDKMVNSLDEPGTDRNAQSFRGGAPLAEAALLA